MARKLVILGASFVLLVAVVPAIILRTYVVLLTPFLALTPGDINDLPLSIATTLFTMAALVALGAWAWLSNRTSVAVCFAAACVLISCASYLRVFSAAVDAIALLADRPPIIVT